MSSDAWGDTDEDLGYADEDDFEQMNRNEANDYLHEDDDGHNDGEESDADEEV